MQPALKWHQSIHYHIYHKEYAWTVVPRRGSLLKIALSLLVGAIGEWSGGNELHPVVMSSVLMTREEECEAAVGDVLFRINESFKHAITQLHKISYNRHNFHQINPLGQFGRVVAESVCMSVCLSLCVFVPFPCNFFLRNEIKSFSIILRLV